jgi:hypothetical protein
MDDRQLLLEQLATLQVAYAHLQAENAQLRKQLEQVQHQLQTILQRRKKTRGTADPQKSKTDRRRKGQRKHPGTTRPEPPPGTVFIEHTVIPEQCPHCGSHDLTPTGEVTEHTCADIPEPKIEWHRYRHPIHQCRQCQRTCAGQGELELPGAHLGPRARLLTCYARAHLGISLGKTQHLLHDYFGLEVSRAGLLGHLHWGGALFAPVVEELWEMLRKSPVVHGDETGWRIDGQPAWAWCFCDPNMALFLIDRHRNRQVLIDALGTTFSGTLVSDFYAVYNGLDCPKQRCLVHLLRELHKLREALPGPSVRAFIQPLISLFQDAIQLGKERATLDAETFARRRRSILDRFDDVLLGTQTQNPDCRRIGKRLFRHCDELFSFLDDPKVPPDNNRCERDIRGLAAARNDGGTHRSEASAGAFARIKSVIATGMKNGMRFLQYGVEVVRAKLKDARLPLPLAATPNTS